MLFIVGFFQIHMTDMKINVLMLSLYFRSYQTAAVNNRYTVSTISLVKDFCKGQASVASLISAQTLSAILALQCEIEGHPSR